MPEKFSDWRAGVCSEKFCGAGKDEFSCICFINELSEVRSRPQEKLDVEILWW